MRFGLIVQMTGPLGDPRPLVRLARDAEAAGWDGFFIWDVFGGAADAPEPVVDPWIALAAIATVTERMRLGPMVTPLPRRRPWKVAREAASLDQLSNGRLILGVGIGDRPEEFSRFGEEPDPRVRAGMLDEGLEVLTGLWSGEPFSFHGKHYTLEDVQIRPRPIQPGGPPLWIGASVPPAARRAGRIADGFVGTPSTSLESATRLLDVYKDAARQAGRQPRVIMMRDAWVASTQAEADAVYGPHVLAAYQYYWQQRLEEFRDFPADAEFTLKLLAPDRLILGEPETCVREFHRWREATGADYFLLRLRHAHSGGPAHEKIMATIRLFGDRVLPHCR